MPRVQLARADAHEGDAVAVVRVHVRLDLEDEAGHLAFARIDLARRRLEPVRRRREIGERVDQIADAEIAQRRAEEHRRQMPFEKGGAVEFLQTVAGEFDLLRRSR